MPRGDRTGPAGMGSMTGRGAGFCNGFNSPGFFNRSTGGYGMGGGRGFGGRRNGFGAGYGNGPGRASGMGRGMVNVPYNMAPDMGYSEETEKTFIENEISLLKNQLDTLETQLSNFKEDE